MAQAAHDARESTVRIPKSFVGRHFVIDVPCFAGSASEQVHSTSVTCTSCTPVPFSPPAAYELRAPMKCFQVPLVTNPMPECWVYMRSVNCLLDEFEISNAA